MTEAETPFVIVIAPAGRKRENLLAMLSTIIDSISIRIFDNYSQTGVLSLQDKPVLFLIDFHEIDEITSVEIMEIHRKFTETPIALLRSRMDIKATPVDPSFIEIVYDDISIEVLQKLFIKTGLIQKILSTKNGGYHV